MSDVTPSPLDKPYESAIDPAFSAAFNLVQSSEEPEETEPGAEQTDPAGAGAPAPAAAPEGTPAGTDPAPAPATGTPTSPIPGAAELIAKLTEGAEQPADGEQPADAQPDPAGVPAGAPTGEGLDPATVIPAFAEAGAKITERMENQFKSQAFQELRGEIDEAYLEGLRLRPLQMVGMEVPSISPNAKDGERMKILDSQMARDWQEAVTGLIEDEINDKVAQRQDQLRPMLSVIHDSIQLGQNNPDLIPGTKGFDLELATRFVKLAKAYEVKSAQGVIGYQVNVQPLINELRAGLAQERGASGERQKQETRAVQQREKAAAQPRTEGGQFDSPQAGISSKSGMSGEPADDYSAFWSATGILPGGSNLNI